MVEYKLNKKTVGTVAEYGIDLIIDNRTVTSVECISENKSDIAKLAEFCNELGLEPCHFDYIVEDYLTDCCID